MKHTLNYGLSQWELSDRIKMEDFNHDNVQIEQALNSLSAALGAQEERPLRWELLDSFECGDGALTSSRWALKITDWNDWSVIGAMMETPTSSLSSGAAYTAFLDTSVNMKSVPIVSFSGLTPFAYCFFLLFPGRNANATVQGLFLTPNNIRFFQNEHTYGEFADKLRLNVQILPESAGRFQTPRSTIFGMR